MGRTITFEHQCDRRGVLKSPPAGRHSIRTKYLESYDMKAASDLTEGVLDFSRADFREAERDEGFMGHTWSGSTDSRPGTKPCRSAVSPVSNVPFAAWGGWPGRGIPELASPLAD